MHWELRQAADRSSDSTVHMLSLENSQKLWLCAKFCSGQNTKSRGPQAEEDWHDASKLTQCGKGCHQPGCQASLVHWNPDVKGLLCHDIVEYQLGQESHAWKAFDGMKASFLKAFTNSVGTTGTLDVDSPGSWRRISDGQR